ncbi:hypothetical protein ZWY2020_028516 [Hordeum vulgare]|nr:hypothetical protein ZWY2020_028516 [Hordeum vulgare]
MTRSSSWTASCRCSSSFVILPVDNGIISEFAQSDEDGEGSMKEHQGRGFCEHQGRSGVELLLGGQRLMIGGEVEDERHRLAGMLGLFGAAVGSGFLVLGSGCSSSHWRWQWWCVCWSSRLFHGMGVGGRSVGGGEGHGPAWIRARRGGGAAAADRSSGILGLAAVGGGRRGRGRVRVEGEEGEECAGIDAPRERDREVVGAGRGLVERDEQINPEAPLDKVCVLSCGISTCLGASINVAKPPKGSTVAIFGLGVVGLAAAEDARITGASRITGVDLNANRFEEARKFGCTEFVNPKDHTKPVQQVLADMRNGGVDRSVECTSNVNAIIQAFECVHDLVLHLVVQVQDPSVRHAHVVNTLRRFKVDPFTDELFAAFQVSHRQQLDGKTKNIAHLTYCKMDLIS